MREGVKARAIATLTSDMATLSAEEEVRYAEELLPSSAVAETALFIPGIQLDELEEENISHSLKGVRFKALSAPGPTGARPEHLRELLACPNKRISR